MATERPWMRMDLNLLKALHVLLEERSVSRAADRFFVTRSAMSKTLHRLREAVNDPLLVRTSEGFVPTPRAQELALVLNSVLGQLDSGLLSSQFDPAQATGKLRIAAPETFSMGAMPSLMRILANTAPQLQIEWVHLEDQYQAQLADGTLDFAIYFDQDYPEGFLTHSLFSAEPVIWCRSGHPLTKLPQLTLEDIRRYPMVTSHLPSIKLPELLDVLARLEEVDLGRDVKFKTSHLMVALIILCESDSIMISGDRLFGYRTFSEALAPLSLRHIPLFDQLNVDFCLVQHARTAQSRLHQWMAAEAIQAFNALF